MKSYKIVSQFRGVGKTSYEFNFSLVKFKINYKYWLFLKYLYTVIFKNSCFCIRQLYKIILHCQYIIWFFLEIKKYNYLKKRNITNFTKMTTKFTFCW